ncbi:MetQ/NlpA family ABC transporter substrate-binding protein [Ornithinibacillus halophilus]|uniref:Lipoprotein n=1 Tax=Ornithinibacillus halophilus TaxID=930117 RepID=A0A1M5JMH8_9BACI|nr:MetQ/NlpA family ABC transporter substrate-binding protein [Ornithinibacillus halophilus]SHG41718.1 D-methionine transport system substrate-binding protein [Ornithinibacillus halophilus]
MKKVLGFISLLVVLVLAACGGADSSNGNNNEEEDRTLVIGASSIPHAEILEEAKPLLEEKGITLEIEEYEDYVLPNDDLENGDLDANYFQHIPYLEQTVADTGYELDYIDGIHVEPMGVYSQSITSIDEIPNGTEVILSNSVADHARILSLFEAQGLITLDDSVDKGAAEIDDIVENPKELEFSPDVVPELLPEIYFSEENSLVVINTNYAIGADLNPLEDALFIEGSDSEYVNVIAVRAEDKDDEDLNTLVEVLQSEDIQNFIVENYEGAVVPVGGDQ